MKLQIGRAYGAIFTLLPLVIVGLFLFGQALSGHYGIFREFQAALLSADGMLLACLSIWCGTFIFPTFSGKDWPLICLLLVALTVYFTNNATVSQALDALILLAGVTLGRAVRFIVGDEMTSLISKHGNQKPRNQLETPHVVSYFLIGLIVLLAFSSWWHLDMSGNYYHGPRWMGLWDNPNIYGMLMGVGFVLAVGLFALTLTLSHPMGEGMSRGTRALPFILFIAAGMMGVGLFFSYSRGAWMAITIGLLYLAWSYGKLKWKYVGIGAGCVALGVGLVWGNTSDSAPWYLKRLDFSRPSAQHRVSAWRGAVQMMRDHPLGVGWNNAVSTYEKNYSPPEGGAAALTMNSYLMLGTELGLPGLLCFVSYVALSFRTNRRHLTPASPHQFVFLPTTLTRLRHPLPFPRARDNLPGAERECHLSLITHHFKQFVAREPSFCWWRFGLMAGCSRWPRRRCFGFYLN
jgi:hypothetical protein